MNKLKKCFIDTPKGKRCLTFRPVHEVLTDKNKRTIRVCDEGGECPYGKLVCENLKDPMYPDDPNRTFMDFCANVGTYLVNDEKGTTEDKVDDLSENYIPMDGTLEENLYDIDNYYQNLIKKKRLVKITDVIDCMCPGVCPFYEKDHTECNSNNELCVLIDLIHGRKQ